MHYNLASLRPEPNIAPWYWVPIFCIIIVGIAWLLWYDGSAENEKTPKNTGKNHGISKK